MTDSYLTDIIPDSLSGLIFGFEGIRNVLVLLNGPTGCKYYHSSLSSELMHRSSRFDPLSYPPIWFFGQERVPCTYLDKRDYVYGSEDKIEEALSYLTNHFDADLVVIVNSPGAALIGDDLERAVRNVLNGKKPDGSASETNKTPFLTVESPGYSGSVFEGYRRACAMVIDAFAGKAEEDAGPDLREENKAPSVNLLGLSICQKNWRGDLAEIRRMLELCGISVNTALMAGSSLEEIRRLPEADLNIVIESTFGHEPAVTLKERFGTPYIECAGLPVGFAAMEELMTKVCEALGKDPAPAKEDSNKARALCYGYLSRVNALTGRPKGTVYAVTGTAAACLGYCRFLTGYYGMHADCVVVTDRSSKTDDLSEAAADGPEAYGALKNYLADHRMEDALARDISDTAAELVFSDGSNIARLKAKGRAFGGIEISLPTIGYLDVVPKTHLGSAGGKLLTELVLNGLLY